MAAANPTNPSKPSEPKKGDTKSKDIVRKHGEHTLRTRVK